MNPQRIEQRIGRCHRYGQKHDVVVVNFLNVKNEADQRVFELLSEKFKLFEGVFGVSDEVLGAIESGVDFEKRIAGIYQRCRTSEEIKASFDQLQQELGAQIDEAMTQTRKALLENFDEEVHEKLRVNLRESRDYLNRYEQMLIDLSRHALGEHADFLPGTSGFRLKSCPFPGDIPLGLYELPKRSGESHLYRLGHLLAIAILDLAKHRDLPIRELVFDYSQHPTKISQLESLVGLSGVLQLSQLTVESFDQSEDHLLFAAVTDNGQTVDDEQARRLFTIPAVVSDSNGASVSGSLNSVTESRQADILKSISQRNAQFFEAEASKLDAWADDLKVGLEREIKDLDRQIKEARRVATAALTLEDKLADQKQIKVLESLRNTKRRSLFDAQDQVDQRREELIAEIEAKLKQTTRLTKLFGIRWRVQ